MSAVANGRGKADFSRCPSVFFSSQARGCRAESSRFLFGAKRASLGSKRSHFLKILSRRLCPPLIPIGLGLGAPIVPRGLGWSTAQAAEPNLLEMARFGHGAAGSSQDQVPSISQFSDVRPTDWAYQALSNLVERYGCVAGYPGGTFSGHRSLSRYGAAALFTHAGIGSAHRSFST